MPKVNIDGYPTLNFPDDMSPEDIKLAIDKGISSGNIKPIYKPFDERSDLEKLGGIGDAVGLGFQRFGSGIAQGLQPIAESIAPGYAPQISEKMEQLKNYMQGREGDFAENYAESMPHRALATIAEIAPMAIGGIGGSLSKAPQFIGRALEGAPALAKTLGNVGGIFGKNAAIGAAYAPFAYDEAFENNGLSGLLDKADQGALIGGALGTGLAGFGKALANVGKLKDYPIVGKLLSKFGNKESAENSIKDLKGLETNLGDVISSPFIKDLEEKWLAKNPFSGARSSQYNTGIKLEKEGEDILNRLSPEYKTEEGTVNVGKKLQTNLKSYDETINNEKRSLYKKVDDLADSLKVNVIGQNYAKEAAKVLKEVKKGNVFGQLENEEKKQFENFLESVGSMREGSIKGANLKVSDLYETALKEKIKGNKFISGSYNRLASSLRSDLENAINKSENSELKKSFGKAQSFYKKNVVPLNEKEIYKFTHGDADSDTLVNFFLRTGKQDRSNLLSKLTNNISEQDKKLLGREFLEGARKEDFEGFEKIAPKKMINMYEKLGKRTRSELFDKDFAKEMGRYATRVKKNPSAVESLFVPKTGEGNAYAGAMAILGASALAGPQALALTASSYGGSALLSRFLRSEKARDMYLKGLKAKDIKFNKTGKGTNASIGGAIGLSE